MNTLRPFYLPPIYLMENRENFMKSYRKSKKKKMIAELLFKDHLLYNEIGNFTILYCLMK